MARAGRGLGPRAGLGARALPGGAARRAGGALAAGRPPAASAGPPLPYRFPARAESPQRGRAGCRHCQCCQHTRTTTTEKKASVAIQCDDNIQTMPSETTHMIRDSKRKRDSTSAEELPSHKIMTVATVHSHRPPEAKRPSPSMTSDHSVNEPRKSTSKGVSNAAKLSLKRKRQKSTSSEPNLVVAPLKASKKSLKLRKPGPLNGKRSARESSPILNSTQTNKMSKYLQPKPKKMRKAPSLEESAPERTSRPNLNILVSSDSSDFETNKKPKTSSARRKIGPKRAAEESASVKEIKNKISQRPVAKSSPRQIIQNNEDAIRYLDKPKELVIEESDIAILRLFLQNHYPDEELYKFDTNDEYKKMHFYQINPLVTVQRCPRIARMLRANSCGSQLSLVDFATKLGLRSIDDVAEPKRYRTRRRAKRTEVVDNAIDSSVDKDKENLNRPAPSKNAVSRVLKESHNKDEGDGRRENEKRTDEIMKVLELSSDESERKTNNVKKPPPVKVVKPKATKRCGAGLKEYSSLEDHAIVAWVSSGARARQVNGNRLWRELQGVYHNITGHERTWHSLRNRYLRYILPRLASLALPAAHQSRLRAAAATGELKARRAAPRRHSMFPLPPRGAASRDPTSAVPRDPTPEGSPHLRPPRSAALRDPTRAVQRDPTPHADAPSPPPPRGDVTRPTTRSKPPHARLKDTSRSRTPSPSASERRKNRHSPSSASERAPKGSHRRRTGRKLRSVSSDLKFSASDSNSDSSHSEPERKQTRRATQARRLTDTSADTSSESSRPSSPEPPRRKSNRHRSPSHSGNGESNRHISPARARHESDRRTSNKHKPSESDRQKSNIRRSNRRTSADRTRHSSLSESNRRKSNRLKSLDQTSQESRSGHESESDRRKSNTRRSHRHKSPVQPLPISNGHISPSESNRRQSPEPSKRLSLRDRTRLIPPDVDDSSSTRLLRNKSPAKPRMRKLYNPKAVF